MNHQENERCICIYDLNNSHNFQCTLLNNGAYPEYKYEFTLNGKVHQQKGTLKVVKKNIEWSKD